MVDILDKNFRGNKLLANESNLASLLRSTFTCEYCNSSFNDGVLFKCGHIICSKHTENSDFVKNFSPQCKAIKEKKNDNIDISIDCIKCNYPRQDQIMTEEEMKLTKLIIRYLNFYYFSQPTCNECSLKTCATNICLDCNMFLCLEHSHTHSKTKKNILRQENTKKITNNDKKFPIEIEFPSNDININNNNNNNNIKEKSIFHQFFSDNFTDEMINNGGHLCPSIENFKRDFDIHIRRIMSIQDIPLHLKEQDPFQKNQWRLKDLELSLRLRQSSNYEKKLIDEKLKWIENIHRDFNMLHKYMDEKKEEILNDISKLYDKENQRIKDKISLLTNLNINFDRTKSNWNDLIKIDALKGSIVQKKLSEKVNNLLTQCDQDLEQCKNDKLESYQLNIPFDQWLSQLESLSISTKAEYQN